MDKQEVMRRIKLIEKHLNGECEIQLFNNDDVKWATLVCNVNDYYIVMDRSVEVREKPQAIECWANVYPAGYNTYHPSEQSALEKAMPDVIRTAVHMKEVAK